MKDTILAIDGIECGYKGGFHICDLRLDVRRGDMVGIIGRNGSGKTTLMKAIAGDLAVTRGQIRLEGVDLSEMSLRDKARKIAVVSQFVEIADISVEDYVLMGRVPYRDRFQFADRSDDMAIARHYMETTGIYHLRDSTMACLSGGEQQMASIASALSQEPTLLLLDEPTSHLDIAHQVRFMNLIKRLNTELNLSVVMIIHDLNMASEYFNRLVLMNDGRIIVEGTTESVLTTDNIETAYGVRIVTGRNPLTDKIAVFPYSESIDIT